MKRLAFCFDGTWNRLDAPCPTNVVLAAESILPLATDNVAQLIFYDEGVGTDKKEKYSGGIFGSGLIKNLADAYRFLIFNYTPGDDLYVFGFSRGAYTARSFAGLLNTCGVLLRRDAARIDEAIELYKQRDNSDEFEEKMLHFRLEVSPLVCRSDAEERWRNAKLNTSQTWPRLGICYMGVWDTVGALGIPARYTWLNWLNEKHQFHDTALSPFVRSARHAVAIDERRKDFVPTLWDNLDKLNAASGYNNDAPDAPYQQMWFPGVHGAVGGGGERRGLSDQALDWVLDGARAAGLIVDPGDYSRIFELMPDYSDYLNNSGDPGLMYKAMNALTSADRQPGPSALHEVSVSARRRWLAPAGSLKDQQQYRPATLKAVGKELDDWDAGNAPAHPADVEYVTHQVERGDTLSKIAEKYYGKPSDYDRIFQANRHKLDSPHRIYPGMLLVIPK